MKIGKYKQQTQGYDAFIFEDFPPKEGFNFQNYQKSKSSKFDVGQA